ncbi:hypothetical protein [Dactylosporangium sp. NPDC051541]|uniref:hypothetical protein n=1 Tax=Dactylosporangium sp. NPDC051541 TaxID=3363977 RepID=UPI0037A4D883
MRDKLVFFALAVLFALMTSGLIAGMAVVVASLVGLEGGALLVVFGSTMAGVFGGVIMLAALAANLFFRPPSDSDSRS